MPLTPDLFGSLRLLCESGPGIDGAASPGEAQGLAQQDWAALVALAGEHGVLPLVAHRLAVRFADSVPPELLDRLRLFNEAQRRRTGGLGWQMRELLRELATADIPAIPIKGPPLGRRIYGQAWLRGMRDLDILVQDKDVERTLGLLAGLGYEHEPGLDGQQQSLLRRYAGQYLMTHPAGAPVEPHWMLAPRTLAFALDHDRLWRQARPATFRSVRHLALAEGDTLLMLCLHGAKDRWRQLKLVVDVAFFLHAHPDLDWDAVQADAARDGCRRMLGLGVLLAHRLLRARLPEPVLKHVERDRTIGRLAERATAALVAETTFAESPYRLRRDYWAIHERPADRWAYLVRTACQPRTAHYRSLPLPSGLEWAYPAIKLPWDYLVTPMGTLARRVRGGTAKAA